MCREEDGCSEDPSIFLKLNSPFHHTQHQDCGQDIIEYGRKKKGDNAPFEHQKFFLVSGEITRDSAEASMRVRDSEDACGS